MRKRLAPHAFTACMSWTQASLVVVRGHCTPRDNSGRIDSPKYENLEIRKESGRPQSATSALLYKVPIESADGVGYAGADWRGYYRLMASRPYNKKGYQMRRAFRSSRQPKCTAKVCLFAAEPKTRQFVPSDHFEPSNANACLNK